MLIQAGVFYFIVIVKIIIMETLQELKAKREALDKQIAEMEAKEWPKEGESYFCICNEGASGSTWCEDQVDNVRKNGLGIYRTEEQAQHYFNYFKLLREIDAFCEEKNPQGWDWRKQNSMYGLKYHSEANQLVVCQYYETIPLFGKLGDVAHASELLEKFGDRIMEVINFKK